MRKLLPLLSLILLILPLCAQQPKFSRIDNEQGLSQNSVYGILQDQQGFLWIATENGLNRYDGLNFKVYQHEKGNGSSLSGNSLLNITEDSKGHIWTAGNGNGVSRLDKKSGQFSNYFDSSDQSKLYLNNAIWCISEFKNDQYWIGTFGNGLKLIEGATGKILKRFISSDSENSLSGNDVRSIQTDVSGTTWVGTFDGGLCSITDGKVTRIVRTSEMKILRILFDKKRNCLWLATYDSGLVRYDLSSRKLSYSALLTGEHIRDITHDPQNSDVLWLASWGKGVIRYKIGSDTGEFFEPEKGNSSSHSDLLNLTVFTDRGGLIWVGTYNKGLSKVNLFESKFRTIRLAEENDKAISNVVYSMAQQDHTLWIGTHANGLYELDLISNNLKPGTPDPRTQKTVCYTLLPEKEHLWIGTGHGLIEKDLSSGRIIKYFKDDGSPINTTEGVTASLRDHLGTYWFGTYGGGLQQFERGKGVVATFKNNPKDPASLPENTIYTLFEDRRHRLWIGTGKGGVAIFDRSRRNFVRIKDENIGFGQTIHSFGQDSKGTIWVATSNGLVQVLEVDGRFEGRLFTKNEGLSSNFISSLLIDEKDQLWVATTNGINCFVPAEVSSAKPKITHFNREDGIGNSEFLYGSCFKGDNNQFYFGGIDGIIAFDPKKIVPRPNSAKTVITAFRIFNKSVGVKPGSKGLSKSGEDYFLPEEISSTTKIVLSYEESVFSFSFASLDFLYPGNNQYAYKMENFEQNWNYIGTRNTTTYTSLPPGEYIFRVRGSNNDGTWSANEASIHIIISPPWWATWTFKIILSALIIVVTLVLFRLRLNRLKKDKQILEKKVSERTAELKTANEKLVEMGEFKESMTTMLVHDLKNPLGSIVHLTANESTQDRSIAASARKMLNLVMNLLDVQKMRESKISLNKKETDINLLIEQAITYVSLSASQKNIQFSINTSAQTVNCDFGLIERVIINLLSNAIHYSPQNDVITIQTKLENDSVRISVKDNGPGIPADRISSLFSKEEKIDRKNDRYSTGIGLQYCNWALEAHNCNLNVMSHPGAGSEFYFSLPAMAQQGQNLSPNITPNNTPVLSKSEFEILLPTIINLRELKIYEGGKILTCLKSLPEESENIDQWKHEVQKAVFSLNEPYYRKLLEMN